MKDPKDPYITEFDDDEEDNDFIDLEFEKENGDFDYLEED